MSIKEKVYFLTVRQARKIADKFQADEDWDLWRDIEAVRRGFFNEYDSKAAEAKDKRSAS